MSLPLDGLLVLDFSQFLSGPSATLRLADLGARVIKVEHHNTGDLSRSIYAENLNILGESAFFQAINRGKKSLAVNLKNTDELKLIHKIVTQADIVVSNFRPGVMQRLGLDYPQLKKINPKIIHAKITGYGNHGPWRDKPGQDLLVQAISGLTGLSGADSDGPLPMGLAIADNLAGAFLVQGILAAMYKNETALVEVSMLEAILDFQLEPFTLFLNDNEAVQLGNNNAAHALVAAPYGLYETKDGYLTLAMCPIPQLGELIDCPDLLRFSNPNKWYEKRDQIKSIIADHLRQQSTQYWLSILEPADIWCTEVLNWQQLVAHDGFKVLDMVQSVKNSDGSEYLTTRCPINFDNVHLKSTHGAPRLGEHTQQLRAEFNAVEHSES